MTERDVLASQRRYYDLRAADYCDESKPPDRKVRSVLSPELARSVIEELQPGGADGRQLDIVKVFWDPADLEQRLRALGWEVTIRRLGETCLSGVASRQLRREG